MCGTKLSEASNTPQVGVISSEDGPTAYYVNTEPNPYMQTNQGASAPQQSTPYPQPNQGMPTPPPYAPYPTTQVTQSKTSNSVAIILTIILSIVIIAGAVINIISSIIYKNSVMDLLDNVYEDIYEEPYYEDYKTNEDTNIYAKNESVEFKYGTIKLSDIEITKDNFEFDEKYRECKLSFEIENTTDKTIELSVPSIQLCPVGDDYYEECYEWLYDDYEVTESEYGILTLDAGKKKTFVTYYKVPTDVNDFSIMFDLCDYDYIYNFVCYFEASLTQAETTVPVTEPTTKKEN